MTVELDALREQVAEALRKSRMTAYEDGKGGWLFRAATADEQADAVLVPVLAHVEQITAERDAAVPCGAMDDEYASCHRVANHDGPCCTVDSITRHEQAEAGVLRLAMETLNGLLDAVHEASGLPESVDDTEVMLETMVGWRKTLDRVKARAESLSDGEPLKWDLLDIVAPRFCVCEAAEVDRGVCVKCGFPFRVGGAV